MNDSSFSELRLDRVKPRDPGMFRVWRYLLGLGLDRFPVAVETRPLDQLTTPEQVEMSRRAIERVLFNPFKQYSDCRRRCFGGALAASAWGIALEYDARHGLTFAPQDFRRVVWCDGFLNAHDEKNPWMVRFCEWDLAVARKHFKRPELMADGFVRQQQERERSGSPASADVRESQKRETVTIAYCYSRFETPKRTKNEESYAELEPEMRYMACASCGWQSPPQAEAMVTFEEMEPCPTCGAPAERIDAVAGVKDGTLYTNGKRLVICAPYAQQDDEKPLHDGDWEFDYPTFPVALLVLHPVPHKPTGQSITTTLKSVTSAKNALMRLTYETLIKSRPYFKLMGDDLIKNAYGLPFRFSPEDGDVMYGNGDPNEVAVVQGQGVNPSVFQFMAILDGVFRTNESTSEVALSPSQLSEAKVGAVEQYTETGNVVVDDYGKLLYEQETMLFSCVAAALRELPSELVRYRDPMTGAWLFRRVGGNTMPPVEVSVGAGKTLSDLDKDEVAMFFQIAGLDPPSRMALAELAHLDPSVVMRVPMIPQPPAVPGTNQGPPAAPSGTELVENANAR